jgi:hypothetical protein
MRNPGYPCIRVFTGGSARISAAAFVLLTIAAAGFAQSPVAGQNINMVSGTTWPGGDPYLQRQNEPSLAVSSRNPLHLLAGANDYRTVDLPTEPGSVPGTLSGDAWLGVFKSFDGGLSWQSTLLPGYPQDTSAAGTASPLKAYGAAADATVRSHSNGLLYYSGIAFNRGTNIGAIFLSRLQDQNSKENGDATQGRDTIAYLDTKLIDTGTSGQFLDKPWLAVDVPRNGSGATTCSFTPPGGAAQSFVGGNVYMTWSRFTGSTSTKIMFTRSLDCGKTWSNPTKLSESNSINQGTNIAVDPTNGAVYVAWRRFATSSQPDAIIVAKSTDFGKTFASKNTFQVATISPLDQGTSGTQFRTNALPSIAVSVDSANVSRVHVAWAQRNGTNQDAQIVLSTSTDGSTWSVPQPVDASPITDDTTPTPNSFSRGHQFMPQLTFSQGRLMVLYYDQRLDHTLGFYVYVPTPPVLGDGMFQGSYSYKLFRKYAGELPTHPEQVFTLGIDDAFLTQRRHTVDLRVASSAPGASLNFSSTTVSQYRFGLRALDVNQVPEGLDQLEDNPPNLPLFAQGTVPFLGDYIDVAAQNIVANGTGGWKFNTAPTPTPVFYATWTDNRDVRPPLDGDWTHYTPAGPVHQSSLDPTQQTQPCVSGQEGMRNQNIYSSRITQGLLVGSPQNVKPLSSTLQRAFVVTLQNFTNQQRTFHMTIADPQPAGGWASFTEGVNVPVLTAPSPVVKTVDVTVEANSGAARPVFVTSTSPAASITVNVVDATPGSTLSGSIILNPEGSVSALAQPDGTTLDINGLEVYSPTFEVWDANNTNPFLNIGNPDVSILNIGNLNIGNLNIGNADPILNIGNDSVGNLNIGNLNIGNVDPAILNIGNLNIGNATEANLNIGNLNIGNLNIGNLNIGNTPVSDASYSVKNAGNTTHSYRVALYGNNTNNTPLQIIVTKASSTPTSVGCTLQSSPQGVVVATVNNAQMATSIDDATDPKITDSSVSNATVSLAPGERVFVTVRAPLTADQMKDFVKQMTPVITAHGANTDGTVHPFAALLFVQTTQGALPVAVVGVPYNGTGYQFTSVGGSGAITWSVTGTLPSGLTLSPSGLLSGTPTGSGSFNFTVTASDSSATPQTSSQNITMTVAPRASSTTLTLAKNPVAVNEVVAATVTVTDTQPDGTKSFPAGVVTVGSGAVAGSCSLAPTATAGVASCVTSLSASVAGSYPLTAVFTATTVHAGSTSPSVNLTVNLRATATTVTFAPSSGTVLSPTTVGASVSDVTAAGLPSSPAGTVTFSSSVPTDSLTPAGCPLASSGSGISACSVSLTASTNAARTITATYGGSAVHAPSSSVSGYTVKGSTTTTITSINPSPYVLGTPATVSVTVAGVAPATGTPTGPVTVSAGAAGSCTIAALDATGNGSCVWTPLTGGTVTLTATYGGDALFNGSAGSSAPITVLVYYAFTGFLTPMATAGTHEAPTFSGSSNYGSAQPIKWQLKDSSGNYITDLTTALVLQGTPYAPGSCSGPAGGSPILLYSPTTGAKGGSTFRYDTGNNQFIFNWNTGYMPGPGCYEIELQLNDGSPIKATIEQLQ